MTITLTQDQRDWIAERIAEGEFASEEEAQADRGEFITLEEFRARNSARIARFQR